MNETRKPTLRFDQENKNLAETVISASIITQLTGWERSHAEIAAWSCNVEGHAMERYCELANNNIEQLCKVSTLCSDDHQVKTEENWKRLENHRGDAGLFFSRTLTLQVTWPTRIRADICWTCKKQSAVFTQQHPSRNYLSGRWFQFCRNFCAQVVGHGN